MASHSPVHIHGQSHDREDFLEAVSPRRNLKRKRHSPHPSENNEELSSDDPESAWRVVWDASLLGHSEAQDSSNWKDQFLPSTGRIPAYLDYNPWIFDDLSQYSDDEAPQDSHHAPWFPYGSEDTALPDDPDSEDYLEGFGNETLMHRGICYGVIHKVGVKVLPQAIEPLKLLMATQAEFETLKEKNIYIFKVFQGGNGTTFFLQPPKIVGEEPHLGSHIAVLNDDVSTTLKELSTLCTFEAYSRSTEWASIADGATAIEKDTHILVDVVLYGPQDFAGDVGKLLDAKRVYLQEPDYWEPGLGYRNPHFLDLSDVDTGPQADFNASRSSFLQMSAEVHEDLSDDLATTQALLKEKIAIAFKNTTRAKTLKRISADIRILTPLKTYQEEAMDFIMQRETGPISEDYCLWKSESLNRGLVYTHAITGCEVSEKPVETGGGILADEMGLGKTLTMLSAMIRTTDEARKFANTIDPSEQPGAKKKPIFSQATLVVVPSPLLINEWMQEIKLRCTGFSNINIYHGYGREGNAKVLADCDIVLSTYQTISHESADKNSPLWQIKWFRVILDEAHIIRRMSTKLFKSMKKLHANFRWCLTGTPVQNSLEDLAALISFTRASPLDDLHEFRKHVTVPLMKGSAYGVENLRQLLDSICLRRTKQLLNLPEIVSESRLLSFSAREEQQYVHTRDNLVKVIKQNRLQPKISKGYIGVFQLHLQLRRLCNHGTFQKLSLGAEEFDPQQAFAHLKNQKEGKCEVCEVKISGIQGIEEQRCGSFTVCGHLLCRKCAPKMKLALRKIDGRDGCFQCSLCSEMILENYFIEEEASTKCPKSTSKRLSPWQYFDKDGHSTKVSAVVADIEHDQTDGKSIVFSCWTRSLDLVGFFLQSRNIPFVRIDGSQSLGQRKSILHAYENDSGVKILLMTTGTGAIGLNLVVANCVYLLEPQWNPMVEYQAIARVFRLGQERNVRVVRYIMKGTVEEMEMQPQQIRKLEYAEVGWKDEGSAIDIDRGHSADGRDCIANE